MNKYADKDKNEIFFKICEEIQRGESLRTAIKEVNSISRQTFYSWVEADEKKLDHYVRACESRQELIFEDILDIANTPIEGKTITIDDQGKTKEVIGDMIQHRRLQIDARKWMLGKMNPKKYGDRVINENENKNVNREMTKEEIEAELKQIKKRL